MLNIPRYKILFLFNDILLLFVFLTLFGITGFQESEGIKSGLTEEALFGLIIKLVLTAPVLTYIFRCTNLYKINIILNRADHIISLLTAFIIIFVLITVIIFFVYIFYSIHVYYFYFYSLLLCILFLFYRIYFLVKIYRYLSHKLLLNKVLIVGYGNTAKLMAAELFIENSLPISITGCLSDEHPIGEEIIPGVKVIGGVNDLNKVIDNNHIGEVIVCYDKPDFEKLVDLLDLLAALNVRVRITSGLLNIINQHSTVEKYYDIPVLDIYNLAHRRNILIYKRVFDLFFALLGIGVLLPLFIITFISIKVTSRGPAIYRQIRIGKNGKEFTLYKFRSMTTDDIEDEKRKNKMLEFMGAAGEKPGYKIVNEEKVTTIGKLIRKTSVDELPQLINVLRGNMSLVGPRPCLPYEYQNYNNWQKKRVNVLPGCTGLWQIFGRNKVSFIDSTVMDIYYTYIVSPLTDLEYIFRTIPAMFLAKGK